MFSLRLSIVVFLATIFVAGFHQGDALKCKVCSSSDANCLNDPSKITESECKASVTTTPQPPQTTTPQPQDTTTTKPTETPTTKPTETPTTKPTEVPTTKPTETPTTKPTETPTTKPTETPTKPTQAPTTKPTQAPTTNPTETPTTKPTQAPTTKPTETPTTKPPETTTPQPPTTLKPAPENKLELSVHNVRRRRSLPILRADEPEYTCYKLVFKVNGNNVAERGCTVKADNACDKLKEGDGKKEAECSVCDDKDSCNSSTTLSLGLLSIIVPMALVGIFSR